MNDPTIDNTKTPVWRSFNPAHVYSADIIGGGTYLTLNYHDCFYPDNSGSLKVEIFRVDNFDVCLQDDSDPNNSIVLTQGQGLFASLAMDLCFSAGPRLRGGAVQSLSQAPCSRLGFGEG